MKKVILSALAIAALSFNSCVSDDDNGSTGSGGNGGNGGNTNIVDPGNFQGTFTSGTITLNPALTHTLTGAVIVEDGATLVIPAGTIINATGGTSAYIAVAQGGILNVEGIATNPVVMTSGLQNKAPGDWGGVVICGKAPINKATTATAEVSDLTYGGDEPMDSSGSIEYLRIEYAGATFNSSKEFNGLSLFGVGSGTTLDYIQMFEGNDDGIEFFGGTVVANHLVVNSPTDDAFDWTEGWTGGGTDWYADLTQGRGHRGIEGDNLESDNTATPYSNPTISNVTLRGNGDGTENDGLKIRRGTKGTFNNIVVNGYGEVIEIDNADTSAHFATGTDLTFTNVLAINYTSIMDIENATGSGIDYATRAAVLVDYPSGVITEDASATGAGNGTDKPAWAIGWTIE